ASKLFCGAGRVSFGLRSRPAKCLGSLSCRSIFMGTESINRCNEVGRESHSCGSRYYLCLCNACRLLCIQTQLRRCSTDFEKYFAALSKQQRNLSWICQYRIQKRQFKNGDSIRAKSTRCISDGCGRVASCIEV